MITALCKYFTYLLTYLQILVTFRVTRRES